MKKSQRTTSLIREEEDFNRKNFQEYLYQHLDWWPDGEIEVYQFTEGYSNLTYLIKCENHEIVMRRPPLGPLPPKAHDMGREYHLLTKLNPVFSYAPKPFLLCEDETVIGSTFYVMEKKNGVVFDDDSEIGKNTTLEERKQISYAFVDTLAELHQIDYKEVGLSDFGYPEGFIKRQVEGWIKRYNRSKTHEIKVFKEISEWFVNNIPKSHYTSIIHNDFKLNNMMFSESDYSKVVGVFDWEMSTIADPFVDLAIALGYWREPNDPEPIKKSLPSLTSLPGFISREEFVNYYAIKTGRDIPSLHFHMAFTYFKIAVVMQQIYYRWFNGQTSDERFETLDYSIESLMNYAHEIITTKSY